LRGTALTRSIRSIPGFDPQHPTLILQITIRSDDLCVDDMDDDTIVMHGVRRQRGGEDQGELEAGR